MQAREGMARLAEQREQLQGLLHASASERDAALARGEAMLGDLRELHARYEVRRRRCTPKHMALATLRAARCGNVLQEGPSNMTVGLCASWACVDKALI